MLNSCGYETYEWPQLYDNDPKFTSIYQALCVGTPMVDFHLQEGLLCHLGHLCVHPRKRAKMIWETHYGWVVGNFGTEKTMVVLQ